jgi:MoaA/NifB/PqqE/SkfB family radical SAM enzyme
MRLVGRDIDVSAASAMLKEHPLACIIQGFQKVRQLSGLDYRLIRNGSSFYPQIIGFEITHRCNLRCKTCWYWGPHGRYSEGGGMEEMSVQEIRDFVDSISWFRPYLMLTGGEPLLYQGIEEVVRHASSRGLFVGMITNGMVAGEEKIRELVDAGLNFVNVSIDSPEKEIHNEIRNNESSFDRCIKALDNIRKVKGGRLFPIVTVNLTVSNYNYENLRGIVELIDDAGVRILQIQHQWFSDRETSIAYEEWAERYLGMESGHIGTYETGDAHDVDGAVLFDQIRDIRDRSNIAVRVYPDLSREDTASYYRGMDAVYNERCIQAWYGACIKPNGDVVPCIDYVVGNVTETPFKQLWNSEKMRLFRRTVGDQGYFPGCTRCCGFFLR